MPNINNVKIYKKVSNTGTDQYAVVNLDATNFCITIGGSTSSLVSTFNNYLLKTDIASWAKAANKPTYNYSEISAGNISLGAGTNYINLRTNHANYDGGMFYSTPGNEAMVFAAKNSVTSFIFKSGLSCTTVTDWRTIIPGLQIKNDKVTINKLIADGTTPTYNLDVNGTINGTTIYENNTALADKYLPHYTVPIATYTSGVHPVKIFSIDYTDTTSENGVSLYTSIVSGHGNTQSYKFLEDVIINVQNTGVVSVDIYRYYGASAGTYDGAVRQYGDIFFVNDTSTKIVEFFCLMGQYSQLKMTPYMRLGKASGGVITQLTGSGVDYSSGTKTWFNGGDYAVKPWVSDNYAAKSHTHLWQDITDRPTIPSITVSNDVIIFA